MKPKIELTKENVTRWKSVLDSYMKARTKLENYSSTCSNEQWLELFEGQTVIYVYLDYCQQD